MTRRLLICLTVAAGAPELQAEVRRLAAMTADIDPEFEKDFDRLLSTYQRLQASKGEG